MTLQLPSVSGDHPYFLQLRILRQTLARKHVSEIQQEMARLITMLGAKEGGISAETARSLLYVIGVVTPSQYLDENAQSHLRLIKEFYAGNQGDEAVQGRGGSSFDHPTGGLYPWNFSHSTSLWEVYGWRIGLFHPILPLGLGVCLSNPALLSGQTHGNVVSSAHE